MAKIRGEQKWKHRGDIFSELMPLEIELDGLQQKGYPVGKQLGRVRSIQAKVGHKQKTLKRWVKPAPNQLRGSPP